jgi:hypothetical protein
MERQARYDLEEIKARANPTIFTEAASKFIANRSAIEAFLNSADVDSDGRTAALKQLAAFYTALEVISSSSAPGKPSP